MASSLQGLRKLQSWWHRDRRHFAAFPPGPYRTVLDIGAHKGSFSSRAHRYFQPERILLVEADKELADQLRQNFANRPGCQVITTAIAERTGEVEFHVNEKRGASSLLPMQQQTRALFGRSLRELKVVKMAALTLDDLFAREALTEVDLMKVDIQGGERGLLLGGPQALRRIRVIYIEVLFHEFYENCALFAELHERLGAAGFRLQFLDDFRRGKDGDLLYGNACYRRV